MAFKHKIVGLVCDHEECQKEIPADAEVIIMRGSDEDDGDSVYCSWRCAAEDNLELETYPTTEAYLPHAIEGE